MPTINFDFPATHKKVTSGSFPDDVLTRVDWALESLCWKKLEKMLTKLFHTACQSSLNYSFSDYFVCLHAYTYTLHNTYE